MKVPIIPVDDGRAMRHDNSVKFRFLLVLQIAWAAGCDQSPTSPASGAANPDTGTPAAVAPLTLELTPITSLLPRLKTHVAIDSRGNIYWTQESEPVPRGGDLVFVMGDSGVPQTIPALSAARILSALGMGGAPANAAGIRSMAVGPENDLYLLFTGGAGRDPIWAIVRYTPSSGALRVAMGTRRLMEESGMGPSLELARGTLVSQGQDLWLWVRHSDAARILKLTPVEAGTRLEPRALRLKPPGAIARMEMTSDREDLAAGPGQTLYYVDRARAMLWKIDAEGEFTATQSLDGFSSAVTAPMVDQEGRLCLMAGIADPLFASDSAAALLTPRIGASPVWADMSYPAFLETESGPSQLPVLSTIKRDDILAPAALPLQDLQPRQLLLDRTNGTLVTFDASSGELLRLRIVRKTIAAESPSNR